MSAASASRGVRKKKRERIRVRNGRSGSVKAQTICLPTLPVGLPCSNWFKSIFSSKQLQLASMCTWVSNLFKRRKLESPATRCMRLRRRRLLSRLLRQPYAIFPAGGGVQVCAAWDSLRAQVWPSGSQHGEENSCMIFIILQFTVKPRSLPVCTTKPFLMWRRSAILVAFLALVASVDARPPSPPEDFGEIASPPKGKKPPRFELDKSMATKTAYWDLRYDQCQVFKAFEANLKKGDENKYTLMQIQQVVRHGTRYPTKSNMKEIQKLLAKIQKYPDIPSWLQGYKLPYDLSLEGMLSPSGFTELEDLGTRMRKELSSEFPLSFSSDKYVLQHTFKSRTKFSAVAFASKFFDNPSEVAYDAHAEGNDRVLRFFDECARYQRDVKNNPNATIELTRFEESKTMADNIEPLRAKLNLPTTAPLTVGDVQTAYSACSFDLALNDRYDNWCTLMTEKMVKDVEYGEDLETFYEESHGYEVNYQMAAVLLKDIYQNMKDLIDGKTSVIGNFRFAHGETTMPLLTLLGYVEKTKLRADMKPEEIDRRKFRTSRLALFMANVEFRLYKKRGSTANYVQVRVNEQPMKVPGCDDWICDLKKFEIVYKKALTSYNFDKDCAI